MAKSTKLETLKHIADIYSMMCQGANTFEIINYGYEKWNIKHAEMYKLISRATLWIKEKYEKSINEIRLEANIRLDSLFVKLYKDGKYRDAAYVQSQKNKINGLEVKQINIDGKLKLSIKEAKSIADEILKNKE